MEINFVFKMKVSYEDFFWNRVQGHSKMAHCKINDFPIPRPNTLNPINILPEYPENP